MQTRTSSSALQRTTAKETDDNGAVPSIRVLALHGSGGRADTFADLLERWNTHWSHPHTSTLHLEICSVQGHVPMNSADNQGYAWWKLPPGERSSTVDSYNGFEKSRQLVEEASQNSAKPIDLVVAHSQGAILTMALLALSTASRITHPQYGYILNGVAWPNPYTQELESLSLLPTRVLLIIGANDRINPPEQGFRVQEALERAGCHVTVLLHPGGHGVPTSSDEETLEKIRCWIVAGGREERKEESQHDE